MVKQMIIQLTIIRYYSLNTLKEQNINQRASSPSFLKLLGWINFSADLLSKMFIFLVNLVRKLLRLR